MLLTRRTVVGDSKSTHEIARIFESVYNIKPSMQTLGSLEDLYKHMHETRAKDPSAVMSYMPMLVQPIHS